MDSQGKGQLLDKLASSRGSRVTKEHLESIIAGTEYHRLTPTLTVAVITLFNGFFVTGESACADPANYDQEIGERLAYENAFSKLWPLEGYLLRTRMSLLADRAAEARIGALDAELNPTAGTVAGPPGWLAHLLIARDIASIAHEANRRVCHIFGDPEMDPWHTAPEWQRDSCEKGVMFHMEHPEATPADSHASWMQDKLAAGWVYGTVKDPEASPPTHPNLVDYADLPDAQKAKDYLFKGIVEALRPFYLPPTDAGATA